jgi:hypothetical protein
MLLISKMVFIKKESLVMFFYFYASINGKIFCMIIDSELYLAIYPRSLRWLCLEFFFEKISLRTFK